MDELILKCLQDEASAEEQREVWTWLKDRNNFDRYQRLRDSWLASGMIQKNSAFDLEQRYKKVQVRIHSRNQVAHYFRLKPLNSIWKVAALFIFAFLLGFSITQLTSSNDFVGLAENQYHIEVPRGAKISLDLADGTSVWLNAGSRLSYSNAFNLEDRTVHLVGEGYFEVAENKQIPFLVKADGVVVKAIGTAFNVKAYPDEALVEATLVEGIIDVSEGRQTIRLEPNQKVSFIRNSAHLVDQTNAQGENEQLAADSQSIRTVNIIHTRNINPNLYTSWRSQRWIFERAKLAEFTKILERRYDVKVYVMDNELNDYKISGSIHQQTLDQLLNAVRLTVPINYKIINNEVLLTLDERLEKEYKMLMNKSTN
ncbi:FecR family protein [Sunxiuqinia dokdonensis]|uniref:FecR protein domain-containing protein n=1 Tax=Sunxiuqinia dokdonensis TaxID=1409788 RepID=A0A0L8VA36_9BACT|nr:FecR domain-containing protein [Sunxiuqinia dokdonensis]KOH45294.1 hypothetical protein NC99_19020 [Sunxiuqinia dokdonensis]